MQEHFQILSACDQTLLDGTIIKPENPKGIVQFSHGMCEHKERYFHFMETLCQEGYLCVIHDHRGHGKSVKFQDDLGYFNQNGHNYIVEDLHQVTLWIKAQYPNLPLYLFGHSMGSLVVRCYCQKYDKDIDGLIVCGSPSNNPLASVGIQLSRFYSKSKGDHYRPQLIQKLSFQSYNQKFNTTVPNSWICGNEAVVEAYNNNPLCTFIFTANGFETLFNLVKRTYQNHNWIMQHPSLPIHFVAGKDDPCIINEKKFKQAVHHMQSRGYQNVSYHLFDHMRHEILNETNNDIVYQHLIQQLNQWNMKGL